jgi:small-conductance mechanosensitive channel
VIIVLPRLDTVLVQFGSTAITLGDALQASLILLATYLVTRAALKGLERAQRNRPNFAKSHQFVLGRILVYTFGTLGVLISLASLGLDFDRLTLIASALSVGIGFGLQNTINNFISGVILIFERSVRIGDWVVVDQTEGVVIKINLRSTQIQTWDEADVIVPNADMISSKITNWTLEKPSGRLILNVDVAYGSDTALVRKLLLATATSHPAVIRDGSVPEPMVMFLGFGDNALHMELRCFIKDIMEKFVVMSDLYFAIDETLRNNAIEIPFPQRDVHVKSWIAPGGDETGLPNAH